MTARRASRLAWGLWALFFPLAAATKYLEAQSGQLLGSAAESLSFIAAFGVFATVGALVANRQPRNAVGWILLAVALGTWFTAFASTYAAYGLVVRPGSLPGAGVMAWFQSWTWYPSLGLMVTFLILLFPTGRLPSPRWKPLAWADGIMLASLVLPAALAPRIEIGGETEGQRIVIDNPVGVEAARGALETLEGSTGLLFLALVALGVLSVFFRYRGAGREQRQQLKWFLYAAAVLLLGLVIGEIAPDWAGGNFLFAALVSLIPISIAVAVLKHRLYDIDLVINKTVVYGSLAGFITAVYVGVVVGIGSAIGTRGEPNLGLQVAATALVAVAFQPVRARVQHLANRLVYGKRATPYEVMAAFGERMASSIDVEEVLPRTAEAAARGIGAGRIRVRVFLPDGTERQAHWPPDAVGGFDLALPVVHQEAEVGEIAVAKPAGDPLRPAEEALLRDLASQAGLALHNVRLTTELRARLEEITRQAADLRASQARIVTAADDERRRLERTMEDRVERRLEELAGGLRAIAGAPALEPAAASAGLEELRERAQATLEELREIARGIYPPLLADRGLAEALAAQARKDPDAVRLALGALGRYEEDVEAGVYFCCLEAIGSAPRGVALAVREEAGALHLSVEAELPSDAVPRIRDRVEALDGTLELGGDGLRAVIPARAMEAVR
ncbi:MAG TPA: hypothetical protein VHL78_03900 [Actinomycetota bacterium]|nr:hypothetical protein [Actinomycetota bacterium]